jgi:hypothetical protein
MIPSFGMIQWLARDHEDEIRKEVDRDSRYDAPARQQRPKLQERVAVALRGLADRLDPEDAYGAELCAD